MPRKILGVVLGIVAAFAVVMLIEVIGHSIWQPPKGVNFKDTAQVASMMNAMPAMAFHWLLLGWALALVVGTFVARWISKSSATWAWALVAALFLAATFANLFMIPHPQWFNIEAMIVLAIVLAALAAYFRKSRVRA
jgi:glycerol-3-phosphate acyltransferase PlsY